MRHWRDLQQNIHDRARALSAQEGIPLKMAYSALGKRGSTARARRRDATSNMWDQLDALNREAKS